MGGLAEFERKLIRQRCDEGIQRAKARGTVFGRKPVFDAGVRRRIAELRAEGKTIAELAREYVCGEATIWRDCTGNDDALPAAPGGRSPQRRDSRRGQPALHSPSYVTQKPSSHHEGPFSSRTTGCP